MCLENEDLLSLKHLLYRKIKITINFWLFKISKLNFHDYSLKIFLNQIKYFFLILYNFFVTLYLFNLLKYEIS